MSSSISRFCFPFVLTPLLASGCGLIEDASNDRTASGGEVVVAQVGPDATNWRGLAQYTELKDLPTNIYMPEGSVVRSTFGTYQDLEDGPVKTSHQSGVADLDGRYYNRNSGLTYELGLSDASPALSFSGLTQGAIGSRSISFETFVGPEGSTESFSNIVVEGDGTSYSKLGMWSDQKVASGHGDTAFVTYGQQTNSADMPNGTASFSGKAVGLQSYLPRDFGDSEQVVQERAFTGEVNLYADFGERKIYGSIDELSANSNMGIDKININAQIVGSEFSGQAFVDGTSEWATGHTQGMFYGPGTDEQEVGGVFILEGTSGNGDVIKGGFTAHQ